MTLIAWRKDFETGFAGIDFEHQTLIESINDLHSRIDQSGGNISGAIRQLSEIHGLVEAHFALEERIMREEGFSRFREHKADHSILLDEILDIMDALNAGEDIDLDKDLGQKVRDWFTTHFSTFDRDFHIWEQREKNKPQ